MKKASEVVKDCLKKKDMSQTELAASMNIDRRNLNQKLNRQQDMKVDDFRDMLECTGYRMEVVDNNGFRRVSKKEAESIIESRKPLGQFWLEDDGVFVAIANEDGNAWTEEFWNQEECFKYLQGKPCVTAEGLTLNE